MNLAFSKGFAWQSEKKEHALRLILPTSLTCCSKIGRQVVDQTPPHLTCSQSVFYSQLRVEYSVKMYCKLC